MRHYLNSILVIQSDRLNVANLTQRILCRSPWRKRLRRRCIGKILCPLMCTLTVSYAVLLLLLMLIC